MKGGRLYVWMVMIVMVSIFWTTLNRFVWDPSAVEFLSHKIGLKRTVNAPVWLTVLDIHIASAFIALLAGAVNLSDWMFRHYRAVHRVTGYIYLFCVLVVDITSGYMAPYSTGGKIVSVTFNLLNIAWIVITVTALFYAKQKKFGQHRNWMVRSYVFCFTNVSIHFLLALLTMMGLEYVPAYTCSVIGTVIILPLVAETAICFKHKKI